jgi:hypothetical protein
MSAISANPVATQTFTVDEVAVLKAAFNGHYNTLLEKKNALLLSRDFSQHKALVDSATVSVVRPVKFA